MITTALVTKTPKAFTIYQQYKQAKKEGDVAKKDYFEKQLEQQEEKIRRCQEKKYVYQDGSNDPGVSFKFPQAVSPIAADSAVRSHEQEHVVRNAAKAKIEGKQAISYVTIEYTYDPECGRVYPKGGVTHTIYMSKDKNEENARKIFLQGKNDGILSVYKKSLNDNKQLVGELLDVAV